MCRKSGTVSREARLAQVFDAFDLDGLGVIEVEELLVLGINRKVLGQKERVWTAEKNAKLMQRMDHDTNGQVEEDEFVGHFMEELRLESDERFVEVMEEFMECACVSTTKARSDTNGRRQGSGSSLEERYDLGSMTPPRREEQPTCGKCADLQHVKKAFAVAQQHWKLEKADAAELRQKREVALRTALEEIRVLKLSHDNMLKTCQEQEARQLEKADGAAVRRQVEAALAQKEAALGISLEKIKVLKLSHDDMLKTSQEQDARQMEKADAAAVVREQLEVALGQKEAALGIALEEIKVLKLWHEPVATTHQEQDAMQLERADGAAAVREQLEVALAQKEAALGSAHEEIKVLKLSHVEILRNHQSAESEMFLLKTQIRVLEEQIQHMENERSPREADLIDDRKLCEKNKTASAQEGDADQASGADADTGRSPVFRKKGMSREARLAQVFEAFDLDGSGVIEVEELLVHGSIGRC